MAFPPMNSGLTGAGTLPVAEEEVNGAAILGRKKNKRKQAQTAEREMAGPTAAAMLTMRPGKKV